MQHIWIFPLDRAADPVAEPTIQTQLDELMMDWKAHGTPVPGQAEVRYGRFIVIRTQPGATSGCSIDSMTHGVEDILARHGLQVLPHNYILYRDAGGSISSVDFREAGNAIRDGKMGPETLVFDVTMGQSQDLDRFEVRLRDSWLSRYLVTAG